MPRAPLFAPATSAPPRRPRAAVLALLLLLPPLLGGGCYYQRLLAFKGQLAEFERYVEVRSASDLAFAFRCPVLRLSDVAAVVGEPPDLLAETAAGATWQYTFAKVGGEAPEAAPAQDAGERFRVRLRFAAGRLTEARYAPEGAPLLEEGLLARLARGLGKADVSLPRRTIVWRLREQPDFDPARLPRPADVAARLGRASRREQTASHTLLAYAYRLLPAAPRPPGGARLEALFFFGGAENRLTSARLRLGTFTAILTAEEPPARRAARPAPAAAPCHRSEAGKETAADTEAVPAVPGAGRWITAVGFSVQALNPAA